MGQNDLDLILPSSFSHSALSSVLGPPATVSVSQEFVASMGADSSHDASSFRQSIIISIIKI